MYQKITVRKGGTFRRGGRVTKPGRNPRDTPVPVDITGWGITAVVKKDAKVVAALDCTITDESKGLYRIFYDDTSAWPVGELLMDICYRKPADGADPAEVFYTPSVTINCVPTSTPRPTT